MEIRLLGNSGLRVSELCLGTMTFGEDWGWGAPVAECERMVRAFIEAGGNFFDTANRYTNGASEEILGDLLRTKRDQVVIASKYALTTNPSDPNASGSHRKNLTQSLDGSLKRLGTDRLDLYWVHVWDRFTPIDEVLRGLDDAVRSGKVLYVGVSDTPAWVVSQANTLAELRGWSRFVGLQLPYSLVERTVERELLPMAKSLHIGVTAWGILGDGVLSGKYTTDRPDPNHGRLDQEAFSHVLSPRNLAVAAELRTIAQELGCTAAQLAIAWVLKQQHRAEIFPILGARNAQQLSDNLGARDLRIPDEFLAQLESVSAIEFGFPHDFLKRGERVIHGARSPRRSNTDTSYRD